MSVAQSTAIRVAIEELLHGSSGGVRKVPAGLFERGVLDGQPLSAQQARTYDQRCVHRFDVKVGPWRNHGATPLSTKASVRISRVGVVINVSTRLPATALDTRRHEQRAQIEGDFDAAVQALNYPGNLEATTDDEPTGIVSGLLQGPDEGQPTPTWEVVDENWAEHILRSRISGSATVAIVQAIA